ncbi:GntR family transcriptional regulator [Prauserella sp. PE36]|uniref:GntR family transcriptional regulator n=1 Tax=Prauserella sp. PE36 TaxID=1504709 RepID=UPI000DE26A15|nr:GntR family transcriptional regulator [Prauserella sp. PE36]RBM17280.1 GntR family transcriptional regulator [Prauserella sp. PE36]
MLVDRSDSRPLHQQVAQALRKQILDHDLPPGAPLPSEAELSTRFGVARSVVRQAMAALASDGLVIRSQGRPTLVAQPAEYRRLVQRATGLFDQFASRGQDLRTTVLGLRADEPPPAARAFLRTSEALRLERVRLVDGEVLSYVRTWLPAERVPGLRADQLTDASLHRLLTDVYGLRPVRGRRQVRAVAADDALAATLHAGAGDPLLLLEGETTDQHERPLEWFAAWHRADRVVFDIDVSETAAETVRMDTPAPTATPAGADLDRARALLDELRRVLG